MIITSQQLPQYTQEEVNDIVRNLTVTPSSFSRIACSDGRFNGVTTAGDTCDYVLNECVRNHFVANLVSANQLLHRELGYNPSVRYVEEVVPFNTRIKLKHPFIQELGVKLRNELFSTESVSVYFNDNVTIVAGVDFNTARISVNDIILDPVKVIFRDANDRIVEPQDQAGYPRRNGSYWEWAFETGVTTLKAHYDQLVKITADTTLLEADEHLELRYTYYNQVIPVYKVVERENESDYWVYMWDLIDPMFYENGADFEKGEFYKLVTDVEFYTVLEVSQSNLLRYLASPCGTPDCAPDVLTDESTSDLCIIDAKHGIIEYRGTETPDQLVIYYKVNPFIYGYSESLPAIENAVCHLVAAELPLTICKCSIKDGFVQLAQKAYTEVRVNPITGELIENFKHGQLYGQVIYSELMSKLRTYTRTVRL